MASATTAIAPLVIRIGQRFRVGGDIATRSDVMTLAYSELTRGGHPAGADVQKGMFFYRSVAEADAEVGERVPAFIFHSNPFKRGSEETPWVDVVEPDLGYALYHGDNRSSGCGPLESRGNKRFSSVQHLYRDSRLRKFAPPILLFTQVEVDGNRKGFREFSGYGIPVNCLLATQRENRSNKYFTNLVIELALFRLELEREQFDWRWIDARRQPELSADQALRFAPLAWREWVEGGDATVERCRRRVARHRVVTVREQMNMSATEMNILNGVLSFYRTHPHAFEGLAAMIAERVLGKGTRRGWVTKRSADGGVDFVARTDFGDCAELLGTTSVVVLGQAKCVGPAAGASGNDIARLVARLKRGWIGVFVTTGHISQAAQMELIEDKYPVVLVNGKRLAQELHRMMTVDRVSLESILQAQTVWYESNIRPFSAERILDSLALFGTQVELAAGEAS